MKKIFKFMMVLVVGLGFIACTPISEGPGYVVTDYLKSV